MPDERGPENNTSAPPVVQSVKKESHSAVILYIVVALGIALFIRFFIAAPYVVDGASMEPNFHTLDYLIVDRMAYDVCLPPPLPANDCIKTGNPQRGDIIVFDLPEDTSRALIKRVIGLPGETVVLKGNSVIIKNAAHPNGFTLSEPYLDPKDLGGATDMSVTLGPNQYFVLGDNRAVSADSRMWGTLPRKDIVGRVILRLYPFNEIGTDPGQSRYTQDSTLQATSSISH